MNVKQVIRQTGFPIPATKAAWARRSFASAKRCWPLQAGIAKFAGASVAVDFIVLQQEFANTGKSAFAKLAKSVHGNTVAETIEKLRFDLHALKRWTPDDQIRRIGAAINHVKDPSPGRSVSYLGCHCDMPSSRYS